MKCQVCGSLETVILTSSFEINNRKFERKTCYCNNCNSPIDVSDDKDHEEFGNRGRIILWILEELDRLDVKELHKVYKFIRKNIIANIPK